MMTTIVNYMTMQIILAQLQRMATDAKALRNGIKIIEVKIDNKDIGDTEEKDGQTIYLCGNARSSD